MIASTNDIYQALRNRILTYVPSGSNSEMPATPLSNSAYLGARLWILQGPDNPATWPYGIMRLGMRQADPWGPAQETFDLELDIFSRPRNEAMMTLVASIADQAEAALIGYVEPTIALHIRTRTLRDTLWFSKEPADRDVVREYLRFQGSCLPYYINIETATS